MQRLVSYKPQVNKLLICSERMPCPSLCLFTMFSTNSLVVLNKIMAQVAKEPGLRVISRYSFFSHTQLQQLSESHPDGSLRGSKSYSQSATPSNRATHRLKEHNKPVVAWIPSGAEGAFLHSAVWEGTLPKSKARGSAICVHSQLSLSQDQVNIINPVISQPIKPTWEAAKPMKCVKE